jgi:hypothetical protein
VGQKGEGQRDLRSVRPHVAPDRPEVAGPGDAARVNQETRRDVRVDREGEDEQREERPD